MNTLNFKHMFVLAIIISGCTHGFQPSNNGSVDIDKSVKDIIAARLTSGTTDLKVTSSAQSIKVGDCSAAVKLALLKSDGSADTFEGSIGVPVSSDSSVSFYSDSNCVNSVSMFTLSGSTAAGQFYFKSSSAGSKSITANLLNLVVASQVETVVAAAPSPAPQPAPTQTPTQSILSTQSPSDTKSSDGANVNYELGMRFSANVDGQIKAIRFYKSSSESGVHTGKIYSSDGSLLASVQFSNESASGWQEQGLSSPLSITANMTYVVSVNTGNSYYVDTVAGFASKVVSGNLSADVGAGVYGPVGSMPSQVYQNSNYFRDVVFVAGAPAPQPAPTPVPSPAPSPTPVSTGLRGWQLTESNVGLAGAGVDRNSLPVYKGPSMPPAGTVIRLQKITTPLNLSKGNITLDRVWMQPTTSSGLGGMLITYDTDYGADHGAPGPVTIMDSDLDGSLVIDPSIYGECAVRGAANVYRNNIFGMGSGICIFGSPAMPTITVENNYVHDIRGGIFYGQQSHNETATVRNFSGTSMIWRGNYLVSKSGSDSGALFIQAWAGPIQNMTVDGNYMDSWGWDLFLDPNAFGYSNMTATDNRFGKSGYGAAAVQAGSGWTNWSNNYYYDPAQTDAKGAAVGRP